MCYDAIMTDSIIQGVLEIYFKVSIKLSVSIETVIHMIVILYNLYIYYISLFLFKGKLRLILQTKRKFHFYCY